MAMSSSQQPGNVRRGYLILLVDDELCMRELLREFLERADFRVVEAENGREAIEVALREKPRLILMNYLMPVMDGLEASRIIHEHPELSQIPIILNSACDEDEMRENARQAGCVDFIHKPCTVGAILSKVVSNVLVG